GQVAAEVLEDGLLDGEGPGQVAAGHAVLDRYGVVFGHGCLLSLRISRDVQLAGSYVPAGTRQLTARRFQALMPMMAKVRSASSFPVKWSSIRAYTSSGQFRSAMRVYSSVQSRAALSLQV